MATVDEPTPETMEDLLARLGDVPLGRILTKPPPGTATEADVIAAAEGPRKRLCELVDGVLVEKAMGTPEALLASILVQVVWNFVQENDLGLVLGADGMLRLIPGLVRIPDVSFLSWEQLPEGRLPKAAIAPLNPTLAVEVLSPSNTRGEIRRKLKDYFLSGTQLVWVIQPKTQTADVYTSPEDKKRVGKTGVLEGSAVLPGFRLPLPDLFARTERRSKKGRNAT